MVKHDQSAGCEERSDPTLASRPRRPWSVRLIFLVLALWSVLGWLRLSRAILDRNLILTLISPGIFGYLLGAGVIWGAAPLPALWGLMTGAPWTRRWLWVGALLPPMLYWFERLALWQELPSNTTFMLLLSLIWLGLIVWTHHSPRCQRYFGKSRKGK